jgi:CheY-like chemotaxis protein
MGQILRCGRVLIIDDEPVLLRAFRRTLEPPHRVVLAEGGPRAMELLARDTDFDVVLCDLTMPEVDGIEVYRYVAERAPALAGRIVFCTGGAFTPVAEQFLAMSGNRCIEKPVLPEVLREVVSALIGDRGSRGGGN